MTTLTALVLRGHSYTLAHVGDTRAWLLRDGELTQLTQDHAFDHPDFRSRLTRAIGLDDAVRVDYLQGELQLGDLFVLTSDGVHGAGRRRLRGAGARRAAQAASEASSTPRWPPAAATTPPRWCCACASWPRRLEDSCSMAASCRFRRG